MNLSPNQRHIAQVSHQGTCPNHLPYDQTNQFIMEPIVVHELVKQTQKMISKTKLIPLY